MSAHSSSFRELYLQLAVAISPQNAFASQSRQGFNHLPTMFVLQRLAYRVPLHAPESMFNYDKLERAISEVRSKDIFFIMGEMKSGTT